MLRAELDAYYAKLYGLPRDELRYILDPADIYGDDYPSETFRVLQKNETRQHRQGRDVILIDDLRIYETGDYEAGPLPEDAPGQPTEGGADWIRALFADTHEARTILRDQGYLLLLPKG